MVYFEIKEASSLALSMDGASQRPKAKRKIKIMGYEAHSPVKQIWLPLDYEFLSANIGSAPFGVFAKKYKDKYGIDLHDIFKLNKAEGNYSVGAKVDLVGSYNVGLLDVTIDTKYACVNAMNLIHDATQGEAGDAPKELLTIMVGDTETYAHGFKFLLPTQPTVVNSIDDLALGLFEI